MKVAQLMATIPDCCRPNTPSELQKLQSEAPPMGWAVRQAAHDGRARRRTGRRSSPSFEHKPAAAASLGQVHRARSLDGKPLACKLQYPDMQSAVEADLQQLDWLFAIHRRMDPAIDTSEIAKEIGARVREELDYQREAKHVALYRAMLDGIDLDPRAGGVAGAVDRAAAHARLARRHASCSPTRTRRSTIRNRHRAGDVHRLVASVQPLRRDPRRSASRQLHGVRARAAQPAGINLLDYGCIRIFPPKFVGGVVDLYNGLARRRRRSRRARLRDLGLQGADARTDRHPQHLGASFIYGPLLDDRVRTIADGVKPSEYGRREAFRVHQALKQEGPVTVPREFVFMDRAAIGLGGVFLHLARELNFYRLFNEAIENFSRRRGRPSGRRAALAKVGPRPRPMSGADSRLTSASFAALPLPLPRQLR